MPPLPNQDPGYSTLEVFNGQAWQHTQPEPQVVYDDETLPEPVPKTPLSAKPEEGLQMLPLPPPSAEKTLGSRRRKFFIIVGLIVVVIIIGIGVGVGVGVTQGKSTPEDDGAGGGGDSGNGGTGEGVTEPNPDTPVLDTSKLAAVSWTDNEGNTLRAVFWQAKANESLMMSIWDSVNATWGVVDIGTSAETSDPSLSLEAKSGTSLAAVANGAPNAGTDYKAFRLFVAYTNPAGYLRGLNTRIPGCEVWDFDGLTTTLDTPPTSPDSQLAAWWPVCNATECDDAVLYFEDSDQNLRMMQRRQWLEGAMSLGTNTLQPGSGISVAPVSQDSNLDKIIVIYDQSSIIRHQTFGADSNFGAESQGNPPFPFGIHDLIDALS
jgi:hypothetical protein